MTAETLPLVHQASEKAGLEHDTVELIRDGENTLYRLPSGVVARVSRAGQTNAADRELQVTRWLTDASVPVVRPLNGISTPAVVNERAVTFWHELPTHTQGTTNDVAALLRQVHGLTPPDSLELPELAPFVRLAERIDAARSLDSRDRAWLQKRLAELEQAYAELPTGLPWRVVHGDAWRGNVAATANGPVMLDFERCAFGPPEWDLVSTAVSRVTTGWLAADEWAEYCRAYGYDVTTWDGFTVLRDIRELRMTTMAAQITDTTPSTAPQLAHRLACLQGHNGPRPWSGWRPVP